MHIEEPRQAEQQLARARFDSDSASAAFGRQADQQARAADSRLPGRRASPESRTPRRGSPGRRFRAAAHRPSRPDAPGKRSASHTSAVRDDPAGKTQRETRRDASAVRAYMAVHGGVDGVRAHRQRRPVALAEHFRHDPQRAPEQPAPLSHIEADDHHREHARRDVRPRSAGCAARPCADAPNSSKPSIANTDLRDRLQRRADRDLPRGRVTRSACRVAPNCRTIITGPPIWPARQQAVHRFARSSARIRRRAPSRDRGALVEQHGNRARVPARAAANAARRRAARPPARRERSVDATGPKPCHASSATKSATPDGQQNHCSPRHAPPPLRFVSWLNT